MAAQSPWWTPDVHADRRPLLVARAQVRAALRAFFVAHDFLEIEAGILQRSPGNEAHLHAFATELVTPAMARERLYLHTSPEFAAKKLLAAGEQRIFEFARVFRNRERGALHHPEFTLLEWYRAGETYDAMMADCAAILAIAARAAEAKQISFRGRVADPFAPPERVTLAEAFARFAGIDLLATLGPQAGDRAALARPKASDPRVAERFELYLCGVELANGFGELTDPAEQRRRFESEMAEKRRRYGEDYPLDEDFLAALGRMPDASGCALGFDRLVMLVTGATRVDQVIWTPLPAPE